MDRQAKGPGNGPTGKTMSVEFGATTVFQAIVGAMVNQANSNAPRNKFLGKVSKGLLGNDRLSKDALRTGVIKAVDMGAISMEEALHFFQVDAEAVPMEAAGADNLPSSKK